MGKSITIGFTGHRDKTADEIYLLSLDFVYPGSIWVHGGAQGFDTQVHDIAKRIGKIEKETLIVIRPDYKRYPVKLAPLMRNKIIVEKSDLLVACYDNRNGGGTFDTIRYAKSLGKPIEYAPIREIEVIE